MRKKIIAGNWKMYKTKKEAVAFVEAISGLVPSSDLVDSIICAPFVSLACLVKRQGDNLKIGAQNMNENNEGAYTGEISGEMLADLGVSYVIIGHSERREYYNETDNAINAKLKKAFALGIKPILCVGEKLEVRENGTTNNWIKGQLDVDLKDLTAEQVQELVIAYEPIWAIGTGKTATSEVANETCGFIRSYVQKLYNKDVAAALRIQYGGSVKTGNIEELLSKDNIDGALVGGASLKTEDFLALVNAGIAR
jgi:triosephosphate isomerase